jgi:hypothetical protein
MTAENFEFIKNRAFDGGAGFVVEPGDIPAEVQLVTENQDLGPVFVRSTAAERFG